MLYSLRRLTENGAYYGALAALALLALYPMTFLGKVPVACDGLLFLPPWEEARSPELQAPAHPAMAEQTQRILPWYLFLSHSAQNRLSPLWNPYEGAGQPFLALWRTRMLSPFSSPFYFLPPVYALQLSILLKLVLAGWCAFWVARKFGLAPPAAFFVAVAYELSGPVFLWSGFPMSDVVPWLPLLIFFADRLALGRTRHWPYGAIVVGLALFGGDPETALGACGFAVLFFLVRIVVQRTPLRPAATRLVAFVTAFVLGAALVAIQILPFIEFYQQAASLAWDKGAAPVLTVKELALSVLPPFFSVPSHSANAAGPGSGLYVDALLHLGVIQFLCLPLWFSLRRFVDDLQRRRVDGLVVSSLFAVALALTDGWTWVRITMFPQFGPQHCLLGAVFAFACTAAVAASTWVEMDADECKSTLVRMLVYFPLAIILSALAIILYWRNSEGVLPGVLPIVFFAGFAVLYLAVLGLTLVRPSQRLIAHSLCVLTAVDLFLAFSPGITFVRSAEVFPETDFIRVLKKAGARVGGNSTLQQWPLSGNLVPQLYVSSGMTTRRYREFVAKLAQDPLLLRRSGATALVLTKDDIQGQFAAIRSRLRVKEVFSPGAVLVEDLAMKPRAWVSYQAKTVETFDPALLDADLPPLVEGPVSLTSQADTSAKVTIGPLETNTRVVIEVDHTAPGLLILADAWYPGWKAAVDGVEMEVLPVDRLFRGVPVGPGRHEVVFYYDPTLVKIGLGVSAGTALIVFGGMLMLLLRRGT
ncbi:MAG: YfhO family protein [Candidatus Hydrogenedentes bacterium]|nr:YfhO family protein [Candidatus Hydrogenedentota bacterium]